MAFLPCKMPSGVDTFSNFAAYKTTGIDLAATGQTTLLTTDNNMGNFVVTEVVLHLDSVVGGNYQTFNSSIGWTGPGYEDVADLQQKGSTETNSAYNGLWLRTNKFERYNLRYFYTYGTPTSSPTAQSYATGYATPANTATVIQLNITATILDAGSTGTIVVVGYYTGMRP